MRVRHVNDRFVAGLNPSALRACPLVDMLDLLVKTQQHHFKCVPQMGGLSLYIYASKSDNEDALKLSGW